MDSLGIILFIIFMIFRAVSGAKKTQKGRGNAPQPHFPEQDFPQQTTNQQRPWWEEWDDAEEEKHFPPVKQTNIEPVKVKIKEEPLRKKQFIESGTSAEKKVKNKPKDERRQEQPDNLIPSLDVDQVRQGIVWAEILQPPIAKRNRHRI